MAGQSPERDPGAENAVCTDFVESHLQRLIDQGAECATCPWQPLCQGYFKWPDPSYSCQGVKQLFFSLRAAGDEIRRDVASFAAADTAILRSREDDTMSEPRLQCYSSSDFGLQRRMRLLFRTQRAASSFAGSAALADASSTRSSRARRHIEECEIYWQGGEAMIMGPAWFANAGQIMDTCRCRERPADSFITCKPI